jgi:histidine ammonia-lyase
MKKILIGSKSLSVKDVVAVAEGKVRIELAPAAKRNIEDSRRFLANEIKKGKTLYGVNTGFGLLSNVRIPDGDIESLQLNLIRSHAVGVGQPLGLLEVRSMVLLRALHLAQGHSGVRLEVVQTLIDLLNAGVTPWIPSQGSVGASGDLAPLSHLALVLLGEGKAYFKGKLYSGLEALERARISPLRLQAKEGLALINGTQFITALGCLALDRAKKLAEWADVLGAFSCEGLRGTAVAFDPLIHEVRPHPGQRKTAENLRRYLLPKKKLSAIAKSHENCGRVQDPYSLRCIPQVHGATREVLEYVEQIFNREINSVTDNPLIFHRQKKILSGGNFHGQPVALAADFLAIAVAELGSISEQRISKLINPAFSELPAFLAPEGGLNSGFMIVQVSAAALVSENKTLCHPAAVDSIPTSADKEDHVSMGAWGARKCLLVISNVSKILAMESLAAAQAIDLLRPLKTTVPLEKLHRWIRKRSSAMMVDRSLHPEMETISEELLSSEPSFL